jgi:hypothetical protein
MKRIIISILISCFFLSGVNAATLVPSLTAQIAKQEKINTKNTYTNRLAEIANKKAEARARLLALKNRNNKSAPIVVTSTPVNTTLVSPTTIAPTVTRPSSMISPAGVDMSRVRSAWLGWYNSVRQAEWLGSYSYDTRLDSTAHDWNQVFASGKWLNHHTRNPWDGYYNFAVIDVWFISRGINPKVVNRAKHTENVGYGSYSCNSSDCTDSMIHSIRSTFDFFMSEKGKTYDDHYQSIVQPNFSRIGLSVIVVPSEHRYYLTVHYITE